MNKKVEKKLNGILKEMAHEVLNSKDDLNEKMEMVNDIGNIKKIIDNYGELEEILSKFFNEKYKQTKFEER